MSRSRDFDFVLEEAKYSWELFLAARGPRSRLAVNECLKSD
jgi:hypothetical protein